MLSNVIRNLHLISGFNASSNSSNNLQNNCAGHFRPIFIKFVNALCSLRRPFVVILDDVQWADLDTLEFLPQLITNKSMKYVLFVLIYRDDQAPNSLSTLFKTIQEKSKSFIDIKLQNLNIQQLNDLISCTLKRSPIETYPFAAFVFDKTRGNPFFVIELLVSLANQKLIYFDYGGYQWNWDPNLYEDTTVSKCINSILTQRILQTEKKTQDFLTSVSFIGNNFSQEVTKLVTNDDRDAIHQALSDGHIVPVNARNPSYRLLMISYSKQHVP